MKSHIHVEIKCNPYLRIYYLLAFLFNTSRKYKIELTMKNWLIIGFHLSDNDKNLKKIVEEIQTLICVGAGMAIRLLKRLQNWDFELDFIF